MNHLDNKRLKLISDILAEKASSSRAFVQYMAQNREYGQGDALHMREAHFIMAVGPGDGKTMSEIAKELSVTHGAVSQIASRLEKKGYIVRKQDPSNRRQIIALLLENGEKFFEQHLEYDSDKFAEMDKHYLSRFTDDELHIIHEYETFMTAIFSCNDNKP